MTETLIVSGESSVIEFTPKKAGVYVLKSDSKILGTYEIKPTNWNFFGIAWYWWLLGIVALITGLYIYSKNKSSSDVIPFGGQVNTR